MTGKYPDFLKCKSSNLYIHFISDDQQTVIYKGNNSLVNVQLKFVNGNYQSDQLGFLFIDDCINKSISTLIIQRKAFNFNTPILECPQDITSSEPIVSFEAVSTGGLNLSYSHNNKNTAFPLGKTSVRVTATHSNFKINLQCTFNIQIVDLQPPILTCPSNIIQKNRVVRYAATAKDNLESNIKIIYSVAPGSKFQNGVKNVNVTAADSSGNQAKCTFTVQILGSSSTSQVILIVSVIGGVLVVAGIFIALIALARCKRSKKLCFKDKNKADTYKIQSEIECSEGTGGI